VKHLSAWVKTPVKIITKTAGSDGGSSHDNNVRRQGAWCLDIVTGPYISHFQLEPTAFLLLRGQSSGISRPSVSGCDGDEERMTTRCHPDKMLIL